MTVDEEVLAPEAGAEGSNAAGNVAFDPGVYFEQWWAQMQINRAERANQPVTDEETVMSIESLPGSNCEVTFEGVLHFDGHSMGNIKSPGGALIVTKRGRVDADIDVGVAVISGAVVGNITASERVFLECDALVKGDIYTRRLSVKPGAIFEGECLFIDGDELLSPPESPEEEEELMYLVAGV